PPGVTTWVRNGSSVAGRSVGVTPTASARARVTAESGWPRASVAGRVSRGPVRRGDGRAAAERRRAGEVEPEIEIAELEPGISSPGSRRLERTPGLADATPPALLVVPPRERVQHGVEVGRHRETEQLEVVPDVDDDGEIRTEDVVETARELRAAHAAGQAHDLHRAIASTSARVRAPQRGPSRSRSASVSTSRTRLGSANSSKSSPRERTCARKRRAL